MKKVILSIAAVSMVLASQAQSFIGLSLARKGTCDQVSFSVKSEANIHYYLIEGSKDNVDFDILGRVDAKGNTQLPRSYAGTFYDTCIQFYRVRQVSELAAASYSDCLKVQSNMFQNQQESRQANLSAIATK